MPSSHTGNAASRLCPRFPFPPALRCALPAALPAPPCPRVSRLINRPVPTADPPYQLPSSFLGFLPPTVRLECFGLILTKLWCTQPSSPPPGASTSGTSLTKVTCPDFSQDCVLKSILEGKARPPLSFLTPCLASPPCILCPLPHLLLVPHFSILRVLHRLPHQVSVFLPPSLL